MPPSTIPKSRGTAASSIFLRTGTTQIQVEQEDNAATSAWGDKLWDTKTGLKYSPALLATQKLATHPVPNAIGSAAVGNASARFTALDAEGSAPPPDLVDESGDDGG